LDGHKNIGGIFDTSGGDWPYFYNDFDTPLTHGSYEYWVRTTDASDFQGLRLYSGSIIDTNVMIDLVIDNEKFRYYDGSWHDIADCVDNQWYHIEIAFECTTGGYRGLSQYTFKVWIDGVEYGEFGYWYIKPSATSIQFMGGGGLTKNLYVDAIGYDWDPNYHMGDNLYEGLLLIYNSTGILDWLGYSLDGQTNQTIFGNTTINLPSNGLHSIQVFGNDSIGNSYESNLRYFTVATGAPDITINSPLDNDFFGSTAPNYDISILGLYENVWYTIDAGLTNITVSALTGTIDQSAWDTLGNGIVTIVFYANNSAGTIGSDVVQVIKSVSVEPPPGIPGYNFIVLVGVSCAVTLLILKKNNK
ncbi:MAG: hypothetical protein ACXAAI_07680, partial [Promethearchaeota archaeon]